MKEFFKKAWQYILVLYLSILVALFIGIIINAIRQSWFEGRTDEDKLERYKKRKLEYEKGVGRAKLNEHYISLGLRLFIALLIAVGNVLYFYRCNQGVQFKDWLGEQVLINEAAILAYSFFALTIAGTPSKFIERARMAIFNLRIRYHVGHMDIDQVNQKIEELELKIAKKAK